MSPSITKLVNQYDAIVCRLQCLFTPLLLLFLRWWVAAVFFAAGMLKLQSWDSTLFLFEVEYQVPVIPWRWAAYLGTAAEIILPVFMFLGLLTRPMAAMFFVFNAIAVMSYPQLWEKGFYDHQLWGLMILVVVVWGPGLISIDHWLKKKFVAGQTND